MPRATTNPADTHRLDMKTVPGGYVVARRLTYGEKIQRRALVGGLKIEGSKERGSKRSDFAGEMQLINEQANMFDFQHCIVEHNLTKPNSNPELAEDEANDEPLDFKKPADIKALGAREGEEISDWLDELNNFEDDEEN